MFACGWCADGLLLKPQIRPVRAAEIRMQIVIKRWRESSVWIFVQVPKATLMSPSIAEPLIASALYCTLLADEPAIIPALLIILIDLVAPKFTDNTFVLGLDHMDIHHIMLCFLVS